MTMEKKSKGGRKAPEGGWGWMIVAGCFLAVVCIRAVTRCISMFFVEFQLQFGKDYSTTSWIHSLIDCTTMLCAPLGGFLESRISCRATVILGGLISSAGLVFSSIASSLEHLYVSLGFLTGLGFALCYTPVLAMVGRYFDERKSLAYGIALSGAGIGTFILPPAVQVLIERYSWRGALLILAGFVSNLCVCGALMRPLEPSRDERTCEKNESNMEKGSVAPLTEYKDTEKASDDCSKAEQKQPETNHSKEQQPLISDEKQKIIGPDNNKLVQGNTALLTNLSLPSSNLKVRNIAECILLSNKRIANSANEDLKLMEMMNFNRKAADIAEKREDSGLSKAQSTDACYLDKTISNTNTEAPSRGGFCLTLRENIGFFMFPDFLFLSLSFVFLAYGCSAPVVYLVPYALSVGVVHRQAALLMSIFGISCIVGNFTFGWITDKKCLKRYRMLSYMLAIGMEGIFCLFVPFLHSFSPLVVFSVLYGYFDGAYVALIPVVTCDVVGSSHLTSALGVVYFLHAIPYLISPPIGGWLVDQTGNYEATYFLNGTSFMFSSMALIAMLVRRHCRSKSASATEHFSPFKFTDTLYQLFTFWKRDDTSGK